MFFYLAGNLLLGRLYFDGLLDPVSLVDQFLLFPAQDGNMAHFTAWLGIFFPIDMDKYILDL